MSSFATLGDSAHWISMANTLLYAVAVVSFSQQTAIFDADWATNGFCITNRDSPYWTSHDWCLYVDTILSAVFGIIFLSLRKTPGMEVANHLVQNNIVGILGHGIGHAMIARGIRNDDVSNNDLTLLEILEQNDDANLKMILSYGIPLLLFWLSLLKASLPDMSLPKIALLAIVVQAAQIYAPMQFQFTYVQTILLLAFSINQLTRPLQSHKQTFAYAMYPAMVALPLTFVGWLESTQCQSTIVQFLHGHVMYDAFIPLSSIAYYLSCYYNSQDEQQKKKQKVKSM